MMKGYWAPYTGEEPVIDPQIPLEIGRITLGWTRVQDALDADIDRLSKNPSVAEVLPHDIPNAFGKRLALWYRLVRVAYPNVPLYLAAAREIRDVAKKLAVWRNNLSHGWIMVESDRITVVNIKWVGRARMMRIFMEITLSDLLSVSQDIKRLEDEIVAFTINHFVLKTHLVEPSQS